MFATKVDWQLVQVLMFLVIGFCPLFQQGAWWLFEFISEIFEEWFWIWPMIVESLLMCEPGSGAAVADFSWHLMSMMECLLFTVLHCGRVSGGYFNISQPATPPSSHRCFAGHMSWLDRSASQPAKSAKSAKSASQISQISQPVSQISQPASRPPRPASVLKKQSFFEKETHLKEMRSFKKKCDKEKWFLYSRSMLKK